MTICERLNRSQYVSDILFKFQLCFFNLYNVQPSFSGLRGHAIANLRTVGATTWETLAADSPGWRG